MVTEVEPMELSTSLDAKSFLSMLPTNYRYRVGKLSGSSDTYNAVVYANLSSVEGEF